MMRYVAVEVDDLHLDRSHGAAAKSNQFPLVAWCPLSGIGEHIGDGFSRTPRREPAGDHATNGHDRASDG